jgi:pimeloyl-ACP methyl ester carboxylesterase
MRTGKGHVVLAVQETGPRGAPTVVFLHGVGGSGAMWRAHAEAFADLHCLAPDLPGHGASAATPWVAMRVTADMVADLIRSRAAGGRADVVGLSLGGAVAYELIARHNGLVSRAVVDGASLVPGRSAPAMVGAVAAVSPLIHRPAIIRVVARALGLNDPDEIGEFAADLRAVDPASFRRAFAQAQRPDQVSDVLTSPVPTLLLSGENELAVVHATNAALASLMPRAEARVAPGLGHGWLAVRGDLHRLAVRSWLSDAELPVGLAPEACDWSTTQPGRLLLDIAATTTADAAAHPQRTRRSRRSGVVRNSLELTATPEAVFDYVTDLTKEHEWNPALRSVAPLTPGPLRAGSRYEVTFTRAGTSVIEYRAVDRPWRWVTRSHGDRLDVDFRGTIRPTARGCLLTVETDLRPNGALRALTPAARRLMRSSWDGHLHAIRTRLSPST